MPESQFTCIYRTAYISEISVIKSLLNNSGISYYIENENFASLGPADGAINFGVMIKAPFVEDAKELIQDFIKPKPAEPNRGGSNA